MMKTAGAIKVEGYAGREVASQVLSTADRALHFSTDTGRHRVTHADALGVTT